MAAQADDALPPEVSDSIEANIKDCKTSLTFKKGFLTKMDVNADGRDDYILDYGDYGCGDAASLYCGTSGCLTTVFVSLSSGGYAKVLDENVRGLTFKTLKGRAAMVFDVHGTACGKTGANACSITLYWNGFKFSPAN